MNNTNVPNRTNNTGFEYIFLYVCREPWEEKKGGILAKLTHYRANLIREGRPVIKHYYTTERHG